MSWAVAFFIVLHPDSTIYIDGLLYYRSLLTEWIYVWDWLNPEEMQSIDFSGSGFNQIFPRRWPIT